MEEKKVHLATKASFEVRSTVSDVVFREESEFEVKMVQNHQKTQIFEKNNILKNRKFQNFSKKSPNP